MVEEVAGAEEMRGTKMLETRCHRCFRTLNFPRCVSMLLEVVDFFILIKEAKLYVGNLSYDVMLHLSRISILLIIYFVIIIVVILLFLLFNRQLNRLCAWLLKRLHYFIIIFNFKFLICSTTYHASSVVIHCFWCFSLGPLRMCLCHLILYLRYSSGY